MVLNDFLSRVPKDDSDLHDGNSKLEISNHSYTSKSKYLIQTRSATQCSEV